MKRRIALAGAAVVLALVVVTAVWTRDYCTTSKHIVTMCLNVIKVSMDLGNYVTVMNYVNKAEQTPELQDPVVVSKLKSASALAHLHNGKYKVTARKFLETTMDLGSNYNEVVAPQDVAMIGGLCALAQFDRRELKERVLDNAPFRQFLELVPHVRELIHDFYGSRYASCMAALDALRPELELDIRLYPHVDALYAQIRSRALVQYFSPFLSVDMHRMAAAFHTDVAALEHELAQLIMSGQIRARIDSHAKILYGRSDNARRATYRRAEDVAEEYIERTHALLMRVALLRHDVVVRSPRKMP